MLFAVAAMVSVAQGVAQAQKPAVDTTRTSRIDTASRGGVNQTTKTIPLHHLSNNDAVKLLNPYLAGQGSVYQMGSGMRAVTVSATPRGFAAVEKVLAEYDRSPVTLTLNFQLIAADTAKTRDPAVAGLDSLLRGVLKFSGYRLLTAAVATVSEGSEATQTLSTGGDRDFRLSCTVTDVTGDGADAVVHLVVELRRVGVESNGGVTMPDPLLFSTGVTIPIGNTVVLGSTVEVSTTTAVSGIKPGMGEIHVTPTTAERALILTVRPTIGETKRRD